MRRKEVELNLEYYLSFLLGLRSNRLRQTIDFFTIVNDPTDFKGFFAELLC